MIFFYLLEDTLWVSKTQIQTSMISYVTNLKNKSCQLAGRSSKSFLLTKISFHFQQYLLKYSDMQPTIVQNTAVLQYFSRAVGEPMCSSCTGWGEVKREMWICTFYKTQQCRNRIFKYTRTSLYNQQRWVLLG